MKRVICIALAVFMAGETLANGVGFTGIGTSAKIMSDTPTTGQNYTFRANLPTFQTKSNRLKPVESAMGYLSSRWSDGYSIPIQSGRVKARMRIVVVDDAPFAVTAKIRAGLKGGFMSPKAFAKTLLPEVEAVSGCRASGGFFVRRGQYGIGTIAFPLAC